MILADVINLDIPVLYVSKPNFNNLKVSYYPPWLAIYVIEYSYAQSTMNELPQYH